jgi:hypothetical protein
MDFKVSGSLSDKNEIHDFHITFALLLMVLIFFVIYFGIE